MLNNSVSNLVEMAYDDLVKGMAIGMLRCGRSAYMVARELDVSRTSVITWWNRWRRDNHVRRKEGSGRPRCTVAATDRKLVIAAKRHRFDSVPRLAVSWSSAAGVRCSVRTAYRRLAEAGLRSYRPLLRIPLSCEHKRRRMEWCQERSQWSDERWSQILWTDESRFTLDFCDGRIRVHRMKNERFAPCCIKEHDRYGGGSVMIWAGIWHGGRTAAIAISGNMNGERYKNEIILPIVIPIAREHHLTFQDDNATLHRAQSVTRTIQDSGIQTLPWPARSPDLSPIEHAWDILGRKVRSGYEHPPTSLRVLSQRLIEQWQAIEQSDIDQLCESMPNRIAACLAVRGGHTRY